MISAEIAANPVHMLYVLEQQIEQQQYPQEVHERYHEIHQGIPGAQIYRQSWVKKSRQPISNPIPSTVRTCLTDILLMPTSGFRIRNTGIPQTGEILDRSATLNDELEKIEKGGKHCQSRRISVTK